MIRSKNWQNRANWLAVIDRLFMSFLCKLGTALVQAGIFTFAGVSRIGHCGDNLI
jgi:hypothetical protein